MKAFLSGSVVVPILDSEYDPETMGKLYDLTWVDNESLDEATAIRDVAARNLINMHTRIAAKLRKEQGE